MPHASYDRLIESLELEIDLMEETLTEGSLGTSSLPKLNRPKSLFKGPKKPAPATKPAEPKKESAPVNANKRPGPAKKPGNKKTEGSLGTSSLPSLNRGRAGGLYKGPKKPASTGAKK